MLHFTRKDYIKRYLSSFITGTPLAIALITLFIILYGKNQKNKIIKEITKPTDITINISMDSLTPEENVVKEEEPIKEIEKPIPEKLPNIKIPKEVKKKIELKKKETQEKQVPKIQQYKVDNEAFKETLYDKVPDVPRKMTNVVKQDTKFQQLNYSLNMPQKLQKVEMIENNFTTAKYNQNVKIEDRASSEFASEQRFNKAIYNTNADVAARSDKQFLDDTKYKLPSAEYNPSNYDIKNRSQEKFSTVSENFKRAQYKFTQIKDKLKQIYAAGGSEAFRGSIKNYNIKLKAKGEDVSADVADVKGGQVDYSADFAKMDAEIKAEKERRRQEAELEKKRIAEALYQREKEAKEARARVKPRRAMKNPASPSPIYPIEAEIKGLEGTVTIRLTVLPDGNTSNIRIISSSGHVILDNEALMVIKNDWTFIPATNEKGERINDVIDVDVDFELNSI